MGCLPRLTRFLLLVRLTVRFLALGLVLRRAVFLVVLRVVFLVVERFVPVLRADEVRRLVARFFEELFLGERLARGMPSNNYLTTVPAAT